MILRIVEKHAEEAASLWRQRDAATDQPHYTLAHLARLEDRLDAHLDGLRLAATGFEIARAYLDRQRGPGELFTLATLALESRLESRIAVAVDFAEAVPEARRGLFGALGWVAPDLLRGRAAMWLDSQSSFRCLLGLVACSVHRVNPGPRMDRLLDQEPDVRARALRLAGELGRTDLLKAVAGALRDEDKACRFWAAWAGGLLGDRSSALLALQSHAVEGGVFQLRALDLAIRLLPLDVAMRWLREFGPHSTGARLVAIGTGVLGDSAAVPWLIERMDVPALARVAGESLSMITGVDLAEDALDGQALEGSVAGEPEDEGLPWPDTRKVETWWQQARNRFAVGGRLLGGLTVTREACHTVLRVGLQRQRRAAAFELALINSGKPLWNWRGRAKIQAGWLGSLRPDRDS